MTQTSSPIAPAVEQADALAAGGRYAEAVEVLSEANRLERSAAVEERIVQLRYLAGEALDRTGGFDSWPRTMDDPFPGVAEPPEIRPEDLSAEVLGGAILNHGCLLVRDLVDADTVARLVADTDRAWEARERFFDGAPRAEHAPHFVPFKAEDKYPQLTFRRKWVRDGGAVWVADTPPACWDVLEVYRRTRLLDVITEYLGERPALSVNKFTLRRVPVETNPSWHQDGAFIGDEIRTVNVWLALSDCGGPSKLPALDIVPKRFDRILETGTEGAKLASEVGPGVVEREAADVGVMRPEFHAGDALLFDDKFLHRTAISPGMEGVRYAVESWFFAPSQFPADYVPLAV